jgi:hypothetical protein
MALIILAFTYIAAPNVDFIKFIFTRMKQIFRHYAFNHFMNVMQKYVYVTIVKDYRKQDNECNLISI